MYTKDYFQTLEYLYLKGLIIINSAAYGAVKARYVSRIVI